MRYNDVRHGRSDVGPVLKKYQEAWDKKGMLRPNGMYMSYFFVRQDHIADIPGVNLTAW